MAPRSPGGKTVWKTVHLAKNPLLGISIVNYFSSANIALLVESLAIAAKHTNAIITIVDNSTDDGTEQSTLLALSRLSSSSSFQINVTKSPSNLGYGAGNNLGARHLMAGNADYIWIINPDITVSGDLSEMLNEISGQPADIWATRTIEHNRMGRGFGTLNTFTGKGSTSHKENLRRHRFSLEYPAGHSILFSRTAWERLGGFDERYFLFMEEADLTLRALALGISIGQIESICVVHSQGLTTGSTPDLRAKSAIAYRESTRSRVLFFRRFFPLRLPLLICFRIFYAAVVRARGNSLGSRAVLEGLVAGIRNTYQRR